MYLYFQILDLYLGREEVEAKQMCFASDRFWIHFIFITQLWQARVQQSDLEH